MMEVDNHVTRTISSDSWEDVLDRKVNKEENASKREHTLMFSSLLISPMGYIDYV